MGILGLWFANLLMPVQRVKNEQAPQSALKNPWCILLMLLSLNPRPLYGREPETTH